MKFNSDAISVLKKMINEGQGYKYDPTTSHFVLFILYYFENLNILVQSKEIQGKIIWYDWFNIYWAFLSSDWSVFVFSCYFCLTNPPTRIFLSILSLSGLAFELLHGQTPLMVSSWSLKQPPSTRNFCWFSADTNQRKRWGGGSGTTSLILSVA